jgi:CheY-like chemotaxis protein
MAVPRIVVVDDNPDFAHLLSRLVQHIGYDCVCFTGGADLLKHLMTDVPDLVILDLMMPGMDGLDVLGTIRADARLRDVPVVMFSALADPVVRQRALNAGATDWWLKAAVDFSSFSKQLAPYLSGRDPQRQSKRSPN